MFKAFFNRFRNLKDVVTFRLSPSRITPVKQRIPHEAGAAALVMVLGYFGKQVTTDEAARLVVNRAGTTPEMLIEAGNFYGLRCRSVHVELESLKSLPPASVLLWEFRHFVVFEASGRDYVDIVDPAIGRRCVPIERFRQAFTGLAVVFETTEAFTPGRKEAKGGGTLDLLRLFLEKRELLIRILSTTLFSQILGMALAFLTGTIIDRVIPRRDYSLLLICTLGFVFSQLFMSAMGFMRAHLMIHLRTQLEMSLILRFLDHLIALPYSFFEKRSAGDLMVRLNSNSTIRNILTSTVLSTGIDATMASVYLIMLLAFNTQLSTAILLLTALRLGLLSYMRWKQNQLLAEGIENDALSRTLTVEMLGGMETLKAMGVERRLAQNWTNVFIDGLNITGKRGRLDASFNAILSLIDLSGTLLTNFYGAYLVLRNEWSLGTMMVFVALVRGFSGPINGFLGSILQIQTIEVHVDRLNDVMNASVEQDGVSVMRAEEISGAIAFEDVAFQYGPDLPFVLKNVTLTVEPGYQVAIVGRTGSGKSTLARLIGGLYPPTSGKVLYDSHDLQTLDLNSVRIQLGIVTQEAQLFGGSIRRNIALGDLSMGLDRIIQAAKLACIHEEIMAMPMGYDTVLTDRGRSLSGGQRQRLAIARALVRDPRILILDEATNHLDKLTEERVIRNLAKVHCTKIIITHQLHTVRDFDLIVVVDGNTVIEHGSHQDLLKSGTVYAKMIGGPKQDSMAVRSTS